MADNPRLLALAFTSFCAAMLLAFAGRAGAVPMPVEQAADRIAADTAPAATAPPHQATSQPLPVGTPAGGTLLARTAPVVEPGTLALVGLGLVIVGLTTSARSRARRGSSGKKKNSGLPARPMQP